MEREEIIDYVNEILQRYTDDEAGETSKEKYLKMDENDKYELFIETLNTFPIYKNGNAENLDTNIVICFDYHCY